MALFLLFAGLLLTANAWANYPKDIFTFASSGGQFLNDGNNTFTVIAQNAYGLKSTNALNTQLPSTLNFQYDANGNLTNDGLRSFAYDAENQLTNITVAGQWKSDFVYDGLGRKRVERTYTWTGSAWSQTDETRFVYEGMLVAQERDANNQPTVIYTRGLDLSGTRQGAGGIGGLLARTDANGTAYYHSDGAGNIDALIDEQGHVVARYLYDPFGNLIAQRGELAEANRYRFSSKEIHPASGLYYYGFRFYDPNLQRWLNPDPIGELGGINLYGFVDNDPVNWFDTDGLSKRNNGNNRNSPAIVRVPVRPSGPGGRFTERDVQRELQRVRTLSSYERAQEQLLRESYWRERLGRDIQPGETFLNSPTSPSARAPESWNPNFRPQEVNPLCQQLGAGTAPNTKAGYPMSPQYPPPTRVGETFQFNFDTSPNYRNSRAEGVARALREGYIREGEIGHHINSVKTHPHLAPEPANVLGVGSFQQHLNLHGGNFRNPTSGPLQKDP